MSPTSRMLSLTDLRREVRLAQAELVAPATLPDAFREVAQTDPGHAFLANATGALYVRLVRLLTRVVTTQFGDEDQLMALDWGTGKGHISLLLADAGFSVTACDVADDRPDSTFGQSTPLLVAASRQVVPLEHPVALPFPDNSFHVATSFGVLEHVEDDRASLAELTRVLKPGGMLLVALLPTATSYTQRLARLSGNHYHDRLYRKRSFRRAADDAGLVVLDSWRAQLFPKNRVPFLQCLEVLDRRLCRTPLGLIATNLEAVLVKRHER